MNTISKKADEITDESIIETLQNLEKIIVKLSKSIQLLRDAKRDLELVSITINGFKFNSDTLMVDYAMKV